MTEKRTHTSDFINNQMGCKQADITLVRDMSRAIHKVLSKDNIDAYLMMSRDVAGDAARAVLSFIKDDHIEALSAENERLRKLTCATWFYMPDEGDRCWFSPHEVIDEMYDPEPGNHVFEVECATSLPSIWCAVRVTDDPDADERFTFTEHATEAEARAALGERQ